MFGIEFYEHHVPGAKATLKWIGDQDMDFGPAAALIAFGLLAAALVVFGVSAGQVFSVFFALTPVWLPLVLFYLFFNKWLDTVGTAFYLNQGRTTLRLRLPPEVFKSPEAMEFVISQIHNTANPDNLMQTYLQGKRPLPYSFEIASIGGDVRFYVNVPTKKSRNAFEANLYSQYPGVEIIEEPVDYAAEIPLDYKSAGYELFSGHMGKKKDGIMPLKSYIDFGMDKFPKEEEKVDPMTPMLEVMASIKPYERLFVQIIAISFRPTSFLNGQLTIGEGPSWNAKSKELINTMMNRDEKTRLPKGKVAKNEDEEGDRVNVALTSGEKDLISDLERHMGKYAYHTAIRWVYINKKGGFNGDLINPVIRMFSQFDSGVNALGIRWRTDFDYKDVIPGGKRKELHHLKNAEWSEYRKRVYYPKGTSDDYKIFTAEELATIFHLPGKVALTPTLDRVPSTRGEAPANLPTGELPQ
jgi:hypothetical protein